MEWLCGRSTRQVFVAILKREMITQSSDGTVIYGTVNSVYFNLW
jgi:hypothetical protein